MSLLIFLDIFGIIVFSINGYLTATEKKLDFFGKNNSINIFI